MNILGRNLGHDSSSPLIKKGYVVAAREEERYIKIKQERTFPIKSIND
jgi:predicted NodU family carbamoyl transferase